MRNHVQQVNSSTLLGAGGELSDFSYIAKLLDELVTEDFVADDGIKLSAPEVHAYLTRVMYNRRNKCGPCLPRCFAVTSTCVTVCLLSCSIVECR